MLNDLTLQNLVSYADACETLALKLTEMNEQGFHHMVVPSRGAAPLKKGASSYFHQVWKPLHAAGKQRLEVLRDYTTGPLLNPMFLPFTADLPAAVTGVERRDIRRFWTGVLAAIARGDFANPYYRFYDFLRSNVCAVGFAHLYESRPMGPRFIFLDTVVSGQAVVEIMDAFDEFGLDEAHFILILDEQGRRMKAAFKSRIEKMRDAGRATLIGLDKLFTEDQGPAVSGIWSVTMPEIMELARNEIPTFRDAGAIGAGLYYTEVMARDDQTNINTTLAIAQLNLLIPQVWSPWIKPERTEHELSQLREHLSKHDLLTKSATIETARPVLEKRSKRPIKLAASSSHAIRLHYEKDDAAAFVHAFRSLLG